MKNSVEVGVTLPDASIVTLIGIVGAVRQSIMDKGTELGLPSDHTFAMVSIRSHSIRRPRCCTFRFPVPRQ